MPPGWFDADGMLIAVDRGHILEIHEELPAPTESEPVTEEPKAPEVSTESVDPQPEEKKSSSGRTGRK